jgi:hypothetical protein
MDITEVLASELEQAAWFRRQKEADYPEDPRNGRAALALEEAALLVRDLDPQERVLERIATNNVDTEGEPLGFLAVGDALDLSRFGFSTDSEGFYAGTDLMGFLWKIAESVEQSRRDLQDELNA